VLTAEARAYPQDTSAAGRRGNVRGEEIGSVAQPAAMRILL
jgi:hypothetical protein